MKILHVISSVNPILGGPVESLNQIARELTDRGHLVDVVSMDDPAASFLKNNFFRLIPLGPVKGRYGYSANLHQWLVANVPNYDAVVVRGIWQYHSFAVWRVLAGSSIPYYVYVHGMLDPWFKRTYPLKHLKKWLYWPWAEYRVLRDARRVIFTCETERLLARESFWLYKANETTTAYGVGNPPENGAILAANFLTYYPQLKGKRLVLYLSRIHEKKGCDLLIEAFADAAARNESLHLIMAGPCHSNYLNKLKAQADGLGISDRITWPGMLQGDLKWGAFYATEVFCLPSHQENFGIVVAEALSCGIPVLISNKVNIWREIEVSGAGLVADDTLVGVAENLKRWLMMNEAELATMRANAKVCFARSFRVRRAAERLLEIIQESRVV